MNITELKELAEKATPGPWVAAGPSFGDPLPRYLTSVVVDREEDDDHADEICRAPGGCESICTSDMEFIAAANPAAILELIAAHEDAQGEIRALRATEAGLRERVKELEEGLKSCHGSLKFLGDASDGDVSPKAWRKSGAEASELQALNLLLQNRALLEKKE